MVAMLGILLRRLEEVVMVHLVEDPTVLLEIAVQYLANSHLVRILHMGTGSEYQPKDFLCQSLLLRLEGHPFQNHRRPLAAG
jgi:hypothetical protein